MSICKELIDVAADAGCNAVKFQKRDLDKVYTQEFLDSHKAWQASTFVYFLDVLTLEILPLNKMFSFVSNFMSAASVETAKNTMLNAVTLIK